MYEACWYHNSKSVVVHDQNDTYENEMYQNAYFLWTLYDESGEPKGVINLVTILIYLLLLRE